MSVDINKFKKTLTSLLPQQEGFNYLEYVNSPLFAVMQYKPNIVAFAELNGDAAVSREKSFNFFRQQFTSQICNQL